MEEVKQILDLLHLEGWSDNLINKINASLVSSRINTVFTLSLNLQLKFAHRILNKKGFDPKIDYGRYICNISNLPE